MWRQIVIEWSQVTRLRQEADAQLFTAMKVLERYGCASLSDSTFKQSRVTRVDHMLDRFLSASRPVAGPPTVLSKTEVKDAASEHQRLLCTHYSSLLSDRSLELWHVNGGDTAFIEEKLASAPARTSLALYHTDAQVYFVRVSDAREDLMCE